MVIEYRWARRETRDRRGGNSRRRGGDSRLPSNGKLSSLLLKTVTRRNKSSALNNTHTAREYNLNNSTVLIGDRSLC